MPSFAELMGAAWQHYQAGQRNAAIECVQTALRIRADVPEAHNNLGILLAEEGRLTEAVAHFEEAVRLKPDYPDAHKNLGNALEQQGNLSAAQASFEEAVRIRPGDAETHRQLATILAKQGKLSQASARFQELQSPPESDTQRRALAHFQAGVALAQQGKYEEAVVQYRQALQLKPHDLPGAHNNLGNVLVLQGKLPEAVASYREAVGLRPSYASAYGNLGNTLWAMGQPDEALACLRRALRLKPDDARVHSNLILTLHYLPGYDAQALYRECRRWDEQHAQPLGRLIKSHGNVPDPERRLRIGYVSPFFLGHASSLFTIPLLSNHDRRQYEIYCYSDVKRPNDLTERHRRHADLWRNTVGLSDQQLAELVREDRIDVLVDLVMHTADNRLLMFARKPAPVQVAWLAYPGTTGLSTMDYRLTDPYLDPPGLFDACYAEESLRLADTFWCYDPLTDEPSVNALPALLNGVVTFGCLNNFYKVNNVCLALWANVLKTVPESRILMLAPESPARQRVLCEFERHGINSLRVEFVESRPRGEYLRLYHRVDIGLDPFPYNGHTTSLDGLWMGVPPITLVSQETAFGRAGWSQLSNLGLEELSAETAERYVELAAQLAKDLPRLEDLRRTLRQRMERSPLMDAARFARNMEEAYRRMWRRWCQKANPYFLS